MCIFPVDAECELIHVGFAHEGCARIDNSLHGRRSFRRWLVSPQPVGIAGTRDETGNVK